MKKRYSEDLDLFLRRLKSRHINIFHDKSSEEIFKYIKKYKNKINNDLDFIYFLNYLLKFINNGKDSHTKCKFKNNKALPFMFRFLNNKLYIVESSLLYSSYLYKDVISINGVSIIKLIKEMRDSISYTTVGYLNSEIEFNFSSVNGIRYLPSIDSNTSTLMFKFSDDSSIELDAERMGHWDAGVFFHMFHRVDLADKVGDNRRDKVDKRNYYEFMKAKDGKVFSVDKFVVTNMDQIIKDHPEELNNFASIK